MQPDAHKRALIAGSIGNFIEWYEFAVYGFLATVIAKNFFQLEGEAGLTSLILTYASFAIAFFFRPLGAVVFGRIGDRIGRKPTLIIVLVLMTLATAAIGVVPVYASIGIAAPLIITLVRGRRVRWRGLADDGVCPARQARPVRRVAILHRGAGITGRRGYCRAALRPPHP